MNIHETTDVWFTAFVVLKGHKIVDYERIGQHKGRYKFSISTEEWKQLKLEFIQSEVKRIEEVHKQLKDLLY